LPYEGDKEFISSTGAEVNIWWDGSNWQIQSFLTTENFYTGVENTEFPWEVTTWVAGVGALPVPVVTAG
jgi:hypothetical protein